jgi:hypothetical protein
VDLELKDDDAIYADYYSADFIEIYSKGRLNIRRLDYLKEPAILPQKGYLIKDSTRALFEMPEYRGKMPLWSLSPPAHWPLIYTVYGAEVDIYKWFDPKIYRILPQN